MIGTVPTYGTIYKKLISRYRVAYHPVLASYKAYLPEAIFLTKFS
jgi:hypothetical protein